MISQTQLENPRTREVWHLKVVPDLKPSKENQTSTPYRRASRIADGFRQRVASRACVAIFSNYCCIAVCIAAAESACRTAGVPRWLAVSVYLLGVLIIASRLRGFENLVHEASHNNLFPNAQLHERLEFLYAFPVFRLLQDYRRSHMMHHKHLGDPTKDPDAIRIQELGLDNLSDRPILSLIGIPLTGFLTYEYCTTTLLDFWTTPDRRRMKTAYWTSIALALYQTNSFRLFAYYYVVPLLIVLPITRYWAEASEHVGLDMTSTFGNSRSNTGFFHRWYLHPHNDGYHAVHHLQSKIPFHALPRAHQSLMVASPEFKQKTVVSRGVLETFGQMSMSKTVMKVGQVGK
ncbi:hypothetical protein MMC21_001578 [Puttea exsequens]|nr:hypothetical protein [Puttea exsequens]